MSIITRRELFGVGGGALAAGVAGVALRNNSHPTVTPQFHPAMGHLVPAKQGGRKALDALRLQGRVDPDGTFVAEGGNANFDLAQTITSTGVDTQGFHTGRTRIEIGTPGKKDVTITTEATHWTIQVGKQTTVLAPEGKGEELRKVRRLLERPEIAEVLGLHAALERETVDNDPLSTLTLTATALVAQLYGDQGALLRAAKQATATARGAIRKVQGDPDACWSAYYQCALAAYDDFVMCRQWADSQADFMYWMLYAWGCDMVYVARANGCAVQLTACYGVGQFL